MKPNQFTAAPMNPNHSLAPKRTYSQEAYERRAKLKKAGYKTLSTWPGIGRGFNGKTPVLCFDSLSHAERYCRCIRVAGRGESLWDNVGYYVDSYCDETLKQAVAFIGKIALHGYEETGGMYAFYFESKPHGCTTEDEFSEYQRDLARWAESATERAAEKEQIYNAQWREGRKLETEIEELTQERASLYETARAWIADLRDSQPGAALCARLKGMLADIRVKALTLADEISEKRTVLATLPE